MMAPRAKAMTGGAKQTMEWLPVGDLLIDLDFQRPLSMPRVRKIMREFDPDLIGVLTVSRRDSGEDVLLDGQHRREAICRKWGEEERVPCQVFHGLTHQREAAIFSEMNQRRTRLHAIEAYHADLAAEVDAIVGIEKVLKRHGLRVSRGNVAHTTASPVSLRRIYDSSEYGPQILDVTLSYCVGAGWTDEGSLSGEAMIGVAVLLARYSGYLDGKRLHQVLLNNSPDRLVASARRLRIEFTDQADLGTTIARLLHDRYNRNRRTANRFRWVDAPTERQYWNPIPREKLEPVE